MRYRSGEAVTAAKGLLGGLPPGFSTAQVGPGQLLKWAISSAR
jgi:hypothetical protein